MPVLYVHTRHGAIGIDHADNDAGLTAAKSATDTLSRLKPRKRNAIYFHLSRDNPNPVAESAATVSEIEQAMGGLCFLFADDGN